jgi:mannose-6-phosphate isomerase-like protein (cupin superfamily)
MPYLLASAKRSVMKRISYIAVFLFGALFTWMLVAFTDHRQVGYILEHEKDIAVEQPGPHKGGGLTTAYPFFSKAGDFKIAFRKRVLRPGSAIGYHLQKEDEIYYILDGKGEMTMNGKTFPVTAGDAILTRPGSSHSIRPVGEDSLTLIINYILQ